MAEPQDNLQASEGPPDITDPETFAALYLRAYPRLRLLAAGIIGDPTHAEDIVQEAAMIALQKSDRFEAGSSFVAWLSEIVRRCSMNYVRKVRNRSTVATDPHLLAEVNRDGTPGEGRSPVVPESGVLKESQTDFDDQVLQALGELGHDARCCLLLRIVQGLSYAEISLLLDIPEGTAMSHVHRSKHYLRSRLQQMSQPDHETLGREP